jgi:hypothetical protein
MALGAILLLAFDESGLDRPGCDSGSASDGYH